VLRKILISFIFFTCLSSFAFSAPCYGTKMPKKGEWFWGLEVNSIIKRNLEGRAGKFRSSQAFLTGSFGILDWLCFDGKLGYGFVKYHPLDFEEIDYKESFAGAYGFRIKMYNSPFDDFKTVFGFQHISVHPHHKIISDIKRRVIFDDWQLSFIVSYNRLDKFTPYLGVKVSRGDVIEWHNDKRNRMKSEDSQMLGVVGGFDFYFSQRCWLNIEARFLDEKAGSVRLTYAF